MVVIGGAHAGQRVEDVAGPMLRLAMYATPQAMLPGRGLPPDTTVREVEYRRVRLAELDVTLEAWVHPSVLSPLRELLDHYRPIRAVVSEEG
jgi:hypothetical protein